MPSVAEPTHSPLPTEASAHGCFETMRAYGGRVFRLERHLDRLEASARYLSVGTLPERRQLKTRLLKALAASGLREATVRIALMPHGSGESSGRPRVGRAETLWPSIIVQPAQPPSAEAYRRGIRVAIVPTRAMAVGAVTPQAKYAARLSSIMATQEATLRGADEAIFMSALGSVTESTASNFGLVKGGAVFTPPCWLGLLQGITRDVVAEVASALRIPYHEVPLTRHEVYVADEAFLSSTTKEILSIARVDGRAIGSGRQGSVTKRLHRAFRELVRRELRNGHH